MRRYVEVAAGFDVDLVERGVDLLLTGAIPGYDGRFAPTPPQLGTACRRAAEKRAHERYLEGFTAPRLPAPEIEKTPEQREHAKAMVDAFVRSQSPFGQDGAAEREAKDRLARHDSFYADDYVPTDGGVGRISKTLAKQLGYSVGSPESEENAA